MACGKALYRYIHTERIFAEPGARPHQIDGMDIIHIIHMTLSVRRVRMYNERIFGHALALLDAMPLDLPCPGSRSFVAPTLPLDRIMIVSGYVFVAFLARSGIYPIVIFWLSIC